MRLSACERESRPQSRTATWLCPGPVNPSICSNVATKHMGEESQAQSGKTWNLKFNVVTLPPGMTRPGHTFIAAFLRTDLSLVMLPRSPPWKQKSASDATFCHFDIHWLVIFSQLAHLRQRASEKGGEVTDEGSTPPFLHTSPFCLTGRHTRNIWRLWRTGMTTAMTAMLGCPQAHRITLCGVKPGVPFRPELLPGDANMQRGLRNTELNPPTSPG